MGGSVAWIRVVLFGLEFRKLEREVFILGLYCCYRYRVGRKFGDIYLFSIYLGSVCCVLGIVVGVRDIFAGKIEKVIVFRVCILVVR